MVKDRVLPSVTVLLPMAASEGAPFNSVTTMPNVSAALMAGEPLSVTRTVTVFVLGPWASDGVQVNRPLVGLMLAPAGKPGSRTQTLVYSMDPGAPAGATFNG